MNRKKKKGWLKHLDFMIVDILCLELAYLVSYLIRHPDVFMFRGTTLYLHLSMILLVIDICYVLLRPVYKNILKRSFLAEIRSVIVQNVTIWAIMIVYLYAIQQAFYFSRTLFLQAAICSIVFMLAGRLAWKHIIRKRVWIGKNQSKVLLISTDEMSAKMIRRFKMRMYNGFDLSGLAIMNKEMVGQKIEGVRVVTNADELLEYIRTHIVDEVMINLPWKKEDVKELVNNMLTMGVVAHIAMDYDVNDFQNGVLDRIGGYTFLTTSINTMGDAGHTLKRLTDIVAGLVGCAITGVVFVFLAPMIYHASPGPIFYSQKRVGTNGRVFTIYKFRSMYMDAEERKKELMAKNKMKGNMFKIDNDPRIIGSEKGKGKGIGNFIRRTSLDELPQFYNILKGDMSLVGTRPPTVGEVEKYELHHMIRLSMKPGLTGMWQVSGRSAITDFEKIVELDASYIENWSLMLDLKIILKTFKVVIARSGAE